MGRPQKIQVVEGEKYGHLIVIEEVDKRREMRRIKCKCVYKKCNTIKEINLYDLVKGKIRSCGCFKIETLVKESYRHGHAYHPLQNVHSGLLRRCYSKKSAQYPDYGGRGIRVCKEWRLKEGIGYRNFINWANSLPKSKQWKPGLQLDRENNDGNYEPSNCRFVTRIVNANNKRPYKKHKSKGAVK